MELCQDVIGLIYKKIPFDVKNMMLTCRYFYNTYQFIKKDYCIGNYILTDIQQRMIHDMTEHINYSDKSLIIQSNISTGKTAACLAFALRYKGTTVMMVPVSIIPHWYNEVIKMYGSLNAVKIGIVNENYMSKNEMSIQYQNNYNPSLNGYKVLIISHQAKYFNLTLTVANSNIKLLTKHSVVIIDEVHKKSIRYNEPKVIGVTASKTKWHTAIYKIYSEEEALPEIKSKNILSFNINDTITQIKNISPGPYLLLCDDKKMIKSDYVEYQRDIKSLSKMNNLKPEEVGLLSPSKDATGINLTNIKTIIFVYPTHHMNESVIQAIGRATRVTSKNKEILLYNLHEKEEDIIFHRSTLSENEIISFCKNHQLTMIKNIRNKYQIISIIKAFIDITSFKEVYKVPPIYFTLTARIIKRDFYYLKEIFSQLLTLTEHSTQLILGMI